MHEVYTEGVLTQVLLIGLFHFDAGAIVHR